MIAGKTAMMHGGGWMHEVNQAMTGARVSMESTR